MLNINLNKYNINNNDTIIVGCSAGPDSMALLHYLKNNTKNNIICCHINHNVREESKIEENFLSNYCKNNNIIFEIMTIDNYTKNNFENEAREKRYNFYQEILNKYNSKHLFLAHHGDDQIETILMKITRGSDLEGYAGIKEISKQNNFYIIRPLQNYTKTENDKGEIKCHNFEWLDIPSLNALDFRPEFIKEKLINQNYNFEHIIVK